MTKAGKAVERHNPIVNRRIGMPLFDICTKKVHYLLGGSPTEWSLSIRLVPYGVPVHRFSLYLWSGTKAEFVFWNPETVPKASCDEVNKHLIHVVATVGHEFQHLEYDTDKVRGKPENAIVSAVKNEADSQCWEMALYLSLPGISERHIHLRLNEGGFGLYNRALYRVLFGGPMHAGSTEWIEGLLLNHDLSNYLLKKDPGLKTDQGYITLSSSNRKQVNEVLAYCRAFTAYDGNIARHAMPARKVSKVKEPPKNRPN